MFNKTKAGLVGAVAVVVILALQAIEHWTVVDSVITSLRGSGPTGTFIAGILLSRLLPLVLAIAAIVLVVEGRRPYPGESGASASTQNPVQTLNQTGIKVETHVHHPPQPRPAPIPLPTPKPQDPPNLQFRDRYVTKTWVGDDYGGHNVEVFVAEIGNELGQNVGAANKVRAHLTHKNKKGEILRKICPAQWTNQEHTQFIPVGESRQLILAYNRGPWLSSLHDGSDMKSCAEIQLDLIDQNGNQFGKPIIFDCRFTGGYENPKCTTR
jgi:hypothetical protein